ncbi:MAG TPA: transcription elongation factor GreA [Candidatus Onthocola gallistercoris]|uniref:Transcription elongation factor GreA n=1 Tax=Candidatus Onthocola gallistercoris TaxID=2840876 RepID=A0A9D1HEU0_9FIRM|nr:transcription elongation factor GreA [Candidatus Onthocola gallistercoris]
MYDKLTQSDIKKMEDEIEYRKLVVRKEAIQAVKEAREHGDLSENFEYHAAKKEKNRNESRIRYLERMIRTAQVISEDSRDDEVGMNDKVEIYFVDDDECETIRMVTTIREDALNGLISNESPLGKAIFGHRVGETVHVRVNDNYGYDVEIRSIEKHVDDSGDRIRGY